MVTALKKFLGLELYLVPFARILLSGGKPLHKNFDKMILPGSRLDWNTQRKKLPRRALGKIRLTWDFVVPPTPSGSSHGYYRLGTCDGIFILTLSPVHMPIPSIYSWHPHPRHSLFGENSPALPSKSNPYPCPSAKVKTHIQVAY